MTEAAAMLRTMTDRADLLRRDLSGEGRRYREIYRDLPCALSRNYQGSRPRTLEGNGGMEETGFFLMLYLPAGTALQAGDRAIVRREGETVRGTCSASLSYPSYALATLSVEEVVWG